MRHIVSQRDNRWSRLKQLSSLYSLPSASSLSLPAPAHLLLHLLNFFDTGASDGLLVSLDAGQGVGGARRLPVVLSTGASHLLLLLLLRLLQLGLGIDAVSVVHVVRLHHLGTKGWGLAGERKVFGCGSIRQSA